MKFTSSVGGLVIALCITVHITDLVLGRRARGSGQCRSTCRKFCTKVQLATYRNTYESAIWFMCTRMCQPLKQIGQLGDGNERNSLGQCTDTESCIPHADCFKGHCRCDIGYDLHRKSGKCRILTECEHFGSHILSFEHHCIMLNDMLLIKNITRDECMAECVKHPLCQTADYMNIIFFKHRCYLQNMTWYGVNTKSQINTEACVHFQKNCMW